MSDVSDDTSMGSRDDRHPYGTVRYTRRNSGRRPARLLARPTGSAARASAPRQRRSPSKRWTLAGVLAERRSVRFESEQQRHAAPGHFLVYARCGGESCRRQWRTPPSSAPRQDANRRAPSLSTTRVRVLGVVRGGSSCLPHAFVFVCVSGVAFAFRWSSRAARQSAGTQGASGREGRVSCTGKRRRSPTWR